jgi:hypothetical protein
MIYEIVNAGVLGCGCELVVCWHKCSVVLLLVTVLRCAEEREPCCAADLLLQVLCCAACVVLRRVVLRPCVVLHTPRLPCMNLLSLHCVVRFVVRCVMRLLRCVSLSCRLLSWLFAGIGLFVS